MAQTVSEHYVAEDAGESPHAKGTGRLRIITGCATSYRKC